MFDVKAAQAELNTKRYDDIQRETACKWAGRAAASYQDLIDGRPEKLTLWTLGQEYMHEALEHAALCGDGSLVKDIKDAILPYVTGALNAMVPKDSAKEEG